MVPEHAKRLTVQADAIAEFLLVESRTVMDLVAALHLIHVQRVVEFPRAPGTIDEWFRSFYLCPAIQV